MGWNPFDNFGLFKDTGETQVDNKFLLNPEYPHSQDARDLWWGKLQAWGEDPNYGAISPDWNDIWEQTQQKVKQYYNGGPLAPGVQDRINSSLARRGMSENPASDFLHAQVGAQEAQDLKGLAVDQNVARNNFANQGRTDWLNSLNSFQAQKPSGEWQTTTQPKNPLGDMLLNGAIKVGTAAATGAVSGASGVDQSNYLESLLRDRRNSEMSFAPSGGFSNTAPWNAPRF